MIHKIAVMTAVKRLSDVARATTFGLSRCSSMPHIWMGRVLALPVVKKAIKTSSKDVAKEKKKAAIIEGIRSGSVMY